MNLKIKFLEKIKNSKIPILQIALGASIFIFLVLIVPQMISMGKVSQEVKEKKKILSDLDSGIQNFTALEQEFESLDKAYQDFMNRLPSQKEFPVFLELFSSLAKKNGVKIVAIEPQKVIEDPARFFVSIPVVIDAYASFHELGKFINELEYSEKFAKIDDIKIAQETSNPNKQQIFLSIHAFCLKE